MQAKFCGLFKFDISKYLLSLETLEPLKLHKMVQNNPLCPPHPYIMPLCPYPFAPVILSYSKTRQNIWCPLCPIKDNKYFIFSSGLAGMPSSC